MSNHESRITSRGFFITGTDTGVGKTLLACALLHALAARGLRVIGMKPVAAGAEHRAGRLINDDVAALIGASNVGAAPELVNPYCFEPAIAPHIAARQAGVSIELARLQSAFNALAARADCVIVEGAGGFLVPLSPQFGTADLAVALGLPIVLVVGMRLGCINHALLTAAAIQAAGLPIAGWIANHIDARMDYAGENVSSIRERLHAPLLARVPYTAAIDPARMAHELDIEPLCARAA